MMDMISIHDLVPSLMLEAGVTVSHAPAVGGFADAVPVRQPLHQAGGAAGAGLFRRRQWRAGGGLC